jgi:hypothetical protein
MDLLMAVAARERLWLTDASGLPVSTFHSPCRPARHGAIVDGPEWAERAGRGRNGARERASCLAPEKAA